MTRSTPGLPRWPARQTRPAGGGVHMAVVVAMDDRGRSGVTAQRSRAPGEEESMIEQQHTVEERARSFARTASAAFQDQAAYLGALPDEAWSDRTGCAAWTMHALAGHVVGEAIWFPHLVRMVTDGTPPLPTGIWEELKRLSGSGAGRAAVRRHAAPGPGRRRRHARAVAATGGPRGHRAAVAGAAGLPL